MPDVLLTPDVLLMDDSDVESADSTSKGYGWAPVAIEEAYRNWQYAGRRITDKILAAIHQAMIETPALDYTELVSTRDGIWAFFDYPFINREYTNDRMGYTDFVEQWGETVNATFMCRNAPSSSVAKTFAS